MSPSYRDVERKLNAQKASEATGATQPSPDCQKSPVGAAIAEKQHLLAQLEQRRQWYSARVTESFAEAHRHAETVQRLTTAINILTLNPNFAEFCELLGLKVP